MYTDGDGEADQFQFGIMVVAVFVVGGDDTLSMLRTPDSR